ETPRRGLATETRKHGAYKRTGKTFGLSAFPLQMFSVALWRSCTFTFALSHLRAMAPSRVPAGECHGAMETPRRGLATETRKHGAYKRTGKTSVSLRL